MSDREGLAEWLLTQISDDEDAANWASVSDYNAEWTLLGRDTVQFTDDVAAQMSEKAAPHVARWHPARVLAECEAKRRIVERWARLLPIDLDDHPGLAGERLGLAYACRLLAAPYADRPGFREEWKTP